jgi:hypothetical protein
MSNEKGYTTIEDLKNLICESIEKQKTLPDLYAEIDRINKHFIVNSDFIASVLTNKTVEVK